MQRFIPAIAFLFALAGSGWPQGTAVTGFSLVGQVPQASAPQPNVPPEQRCVAGGRVTNALTGEPVKKATVRLAPSRGTPDGSVAMFTGPAGTVMPGGQGYSTTTDSDGSFRIDGVNPGEYRLSANRSGYLSASYGAKSPNRAGSPIRLDPAQQKTDLAFAMTPQAVITGKVLDGDGDPVSGGMVQVLTPMWTRGKLRYNPRGGGQINDLGEYRIANLSPGKYYLFAQIFNNMPDGNVVTGKQDVRPVRTYYPSSIPFSGANPVEITAGQDVSGIDIRLQSAQTYHVRGHVAGLPSGNNGRERTALNLTPREDEIVVFGGGQSSLHPDGSFDISGVAPGAYYLSMFNMSGQIRGMARQAVDVGAGDVDGVVLTITPPGSLRGVARLEGNPPANSSQVSASKLHLTLMSAEMMSMMSPPASAKFSDDGTFTIENVMPGKFYLQANAPPGTYLKSARFGNSEVLGKELDLTGGAAGQLELIYRYGPGEIDGQIDSTQNGSASSGAVAQIAVVPEELNADGSGLRFSGTDTKGTFSMANLPPGRYRAYAFEEVNPNALQNPELLKQLESRSSLIAVKENEKKQVQLPLIHADELTQIYARLGVQPQ